MSDIAKKIDHPGRFKTGENHPNYGKNHSDKTKKKPYKNKYTFTKV